MDATENRWFELVEYVEDLLWEIPDEWEKGALDLYYRVEDIMGEGPWNAPVSRVIALLYDMGKYYEPTHELEIPCHLADEVERVVRELLYMRLDMVAYVSRYI